MVKLKIEIAHLRPSHCRELQLTIRHLQVGEHQKLLEYICGECLDFFLLVTENKMQEDKMNCRAYIT